MVAIDELKRFSKSDLIHLILLKTATIKAKEQKIKKMSYIIENLSKNGH